ncbi:MAG: hypothetical protein K8L97_32835 [Anaerolineae bacterium]|nr:hypothetical protein [Anaerolineae bacterium]
MSKDIGEDLVGAWLRLIAECDFVQYNVPLRGKQGEIDIVGINLAQKTAYICEVATHTGGLQYVKGSKPNNVDKITRKFQDDVAYARKYLADFQHRFMLWSPVVIHPHSDTTKYNQFQDLIDIRRNLRDSHQADIEMVVNEIYLERVTQLQHKATKETAASEYPVFRLLQILHSLENHVKKLQARGIDTAAMLAQAE